MNKQILKTINEIPIWEGAIEINKLDGGITNANYLVINNKNKFFVRIGSDIPEHLISRKNELIASKAAAKCGLSPNVKYYEKGILVLDFIECKTLKAEDIKRNILDIIPLIKKIHYEIPKNLYGESLIFWVFHVINNYSKFLEDNNSSYIKILDTFKKDSQIIEKIAGPYEIVFCHNDLLPANFLYDNSRIWIIDWEYAGYNSPLFDLGGLSSNNNFDYKNEIVLLENYFDKKIDDKILLQYNSMKCASLLRETMWSMVSEISSKIEFNYSQYTNECLDKYNKAFHSLQI